MPATAAPTAGGIPARGSKLFDLKAVPAKDVLKNKARVCPPISAICEILDNIFDNFDETQAEHELKVRFELSRVEGHRSLIIFENSGGVKKEKLEPLVRLGVPYHAARGSIGTWGEGLKVATFSLSDEVEIRTHFPGEQPVSIHFEPGWLSQDDWSVPVYALEAAAVPAGSTMFLLPKVTRDIDWSEIMRELGTIYGHKIADLGEKNRPVTLSFTIDSEVAYVRPRPLASVDNLRKAMSFPPEFSPRMFETQFLGENGPVHAKVLIALSARHNQETSGVYIYGNGRLFARAQRNRAVGYNESGNSILRDHPTCWRIHVFAFLQADAGADIPWQAPLKDGISENHPISTKLRDFIREIVGPYSRFAKVAKASELVPYTEEWNSMDKEERANLLFEDDSKSNLERLERLPRAFHEFKAPLTAELVEVGSATYNETMRHLESNSKYARTVINRRDSLGTVVQEEALKALNPRLFKDEKKAPGKAKSAAPPPPPPPKTRMVALDFPIEDLDSLRTVFDLKNDQQAVRAAVDFCLAHDKQKHQKNKRGGRK